MTYPPKTRWHTGVRYLAVLGVLCWSDVPGRDGAGEYKAQGLGLDTCISFLETPHEKRALYYSWIAGYLTAYNYLVQETYSIAEYSGLARTGQWFEKYCDKNPSHLLHQGARLFVSERYRVRLKSKAKSDLSRSEQGGP